MKDNEQLWRSIEEVTKTSEEWMAQTDFNGWDVDEKR